MPKFDRIKSYVNTYTGIRLLFKRRFAILQRLFKKDLMILAKTKNPDYVDNAKLYTVMLQYRNACRAAEEKHEEKPRIPEYVGECIWLIARGLAKKSNFANYTAHWKEEMIADGVENCIMYGVDRFDPDKFNKPFAYFTQIIKWAFLRRIQKEKTQQVIKLKNKQNFQLQEQLESNYYMPDMNDDCAHIIQDYEEAILKKKKKDKERALLEEFENNE
jgi:hypothetical protein